MPIPVKHGVALIARVLPLEPSLQKKIGEGVDPVDFGTHSVRWPIIGKPYRFDENAEIWPNESESYAFDFVIPTDLCEVELYAQLSSHAEEHLHWSGESFQKVGKCYVAP